MTHPGPWTGGGYNNREEIDYIVLSAADKREELIIGVKRKKELLYH